MTDKLDIRTIDDIVGEIMSFERYEVHDQGTEWNCELCGKWGKHGVMGVSHGIYLYNGDEFEGDIICLGPDCLKKVLNKLKEESS